MADEEAWLPDNEVIRTNRLMLTPLLAAHAAQIFLSLQDDRLYRFIPEDPPTSSDALEERYRALERRQSPDGTQAWLNWVMILHGADTAVGTLQATVHADHTATIAYMTFTPHQGLGYAREGCRAIVDHLAQHWSVQRLAAEIDTRNEASIRLVEALDFVRVGTRLDADHFKGAASHEHRYELMLAPGGEYTG